MTGPGARREECGGHLAVTLCRPDKLNALDEATIAALTAWLSDPGEVRFVVLRGDGPSFRAGADVASLAESGTLDARTRESMALQRMLEAASRCPAPLVAAVRGHALGAGCALVSCADIVIAETTASFGIPEVRAGVIPAIVAAFVELRMSRGQARRYLLSGRRFDAAEAYRLGFADMVTDDLESAIAEVGDELRSCGPEALRRTKRLLTEQPSPIEQAVMMAEIRDSDEAREGLSAVREHRLPYWAQRPDD